jgi:putative spermidine/putrescine transport system ATP-binding protein
MGSMMNGLEPRQDSAAPPRGKANSIEVKGLSLTFPNGFVGLKPTDLVIEGGQFCTLLGPSGSGKTTLLRAMAGLATPSAGSIAIGGRDVTDLPVQSRNIGFVFQNYALFPHMNVAENIAYPLKLHNWSAADRAARVKEILDLIELPHAAGSTVGQLSGGQQQRVAIGRALAYRPSLLLLDEPMGALDRRLRQQLGADLRDLQQRTGITAVYVTHDQEEAFILSDKIAVMSQGAILQYSTPDELYTRPQSRFVGKFLGEANFIEVDTVSADGKAQTGYGALPFIGAGAVESGASALLIRPEDIRFTRQGSAATQEVAIPVRIARTQFLGSRRMVTVTTERGNEFSVECGKAEVPPAGTDVAITWDPSAAILLNR